MPRTIRKSSSTGIYHVMLRSINRQEIFADKEDAAKFLYIVMDCKKISEFTLYAYCLMSNHIHLLLCPGKEPLSQIFRRIGSKYACWYNLKYKRTGHLFQDRYKSVPVENENSFLITLRYIIQNPVKANLETAPGTAYPWSSYYSYAGRNDHITDITYALSLFPTQKELLEYLCRNNQDTSLDITNIPHGITEEQAKRILEQVAGVHSVSEYQRFSPKQQKEYAWMLRKFHHLSFGQIARLTGMPKATIFRYCRKREM